MPLELNRIPKEIREVKNAQSLLTARIHQQRIKFHVEKRITTQNASCVIAQSTEHLNWVENLLPHDKFVLYKTMFRYPVITNEITGICFDKLSRVFDGRNPVNESQFVNTDFRDDWEKYRAEKLNEPQVWQTKGWEYFKTEINSILVVDVAAEQTTEFPEPYFYWLTIDRVMAYDADPDTGVMRWLIFRDGKRIVVIDDETYRVWPMKNGIADIQGAPEIEHPHGLGFCPARFFWDEPIDLHQPDVKCSPLTDQLEKLDWYLFFAISKRTLDVSGAYPILSGYEQKCDWSNAENGDFCDGGFIKDKQGHYKMDNAGVLMRCPKCGNKRTVGPGSFVEIPVPNPNGDGMDYVPDMRNPVQMLTVDRNSLDYNVDEQTRLREEIIAGVVGQDFTITNREAFNEQQVQANFEDVTTVLYRIKRGFEAAQQWVDDTICQLRYGRYFISSYINYGTDFYLLTADELREKFKVAKENGASESELDALQQQIIETEYRNNPTAQRRMKILAELEPYPHLTLRELMDLQSKGLIDSTDLRIKLNFSNFVRRFERENTNILEFGNAISFDKKIATIKSTFAEYANEQAQPGNA